MKKLAINERVKTAHIFSGDYNSYKYCDDYKDNKRTNEMGIIVRISDSHGLCYLVQHNDGEQAWYEPEDVQKYPSNLKCITDSKHSGAFLEEIFRLGEGYAGDEVVKWCKICGAVVIDKEYDNRLIGHIMDMRFPESIKYD